MVPAVVALLLGLAQAQQAPEARPKPANLLFEGTAEPHFTRTDDHIQLNAGDGWLRIPTAYADLELTFEFRLTSPSSEAELALQGWRNGEVRIKLPRPDSEVQNLVKGDGARVTVESLGMGKFGDAEGWRQLHVRAERRQLTVAVNDVEIGRYGIDEFVGYVRFHTKKGGVQLRWITAQPLIRDAAEDAVHVMGAKQVIGPRIEREVKPDYTAEAMRGKIEGIVEVEAVVLIDGSVGSVRIVRALDQGLDRQAVAAVRQWRFVPGARNGRLVPVMVNIVLTFKIK